MEEELKMMIIILIMIMIILIIILVMMMMIIMIIMISILIISECGKSCGGGTQTRSVQCIQEVHTMKYIFKVFLRKISNHHHYHNDHIKS